MKSNDEFKEFRIWLNKQYSQTVEYNNIISNPILIEGGYLSRYELSLFSDALHMKYSCLAMEGMDVDVMSVMVLYEIEDQIYDQSFSFYFFIGSLSELTEDNHTFVYMPKYLHYCVIPEDKKTLHIKVSDRVNLVQGAFSLFLQKRMISRSIGSTSVFNSVCEYNPDRTEFSWSNIQKAYISSIEEFEPCCLGCYINLFPLISQVDRDTLLSRLDANLSSSEMKDLIKSFLKTKVLLTNYKITIPIDYPRGLLPVGSLTMTLLDFYFDELDFYYSKYNYYYTRHNLNLFIGIPYQDIDNERLASMQKSIENDLQLSLMKMNMRYDPLKLNYLIDGSCIPLFEGK